MVVEVVVWEEEARFRLAFEWQLPMKLLKAQR
jgi:hypothetical protein